MTTPKDQYPKDARSYPNREPLLILQAELRRLAPSKVTVLLVGGDSSSKQAVARVLHDRSPRGSCPFEGLACSGLDSEQVELALFGGPAHAPRGEGAVHRAKAGTLYVASIDELPLIVQPRFLRFLDQERQGRVVASVGRALADQVARGEFRADLAERLSLVELMLPTTLESV